MHNAFHIFWQINRVVVGVYLVLSLFREMVSIMACRVFILFCDYGEPTYLGLSGFAILIQEIEICFSKG
jgi:hypothetical protein